MKPEMLFDTMIWQEFQKEVRKRRLNPVKFAAELLREHLEIWEDEIDRTTLGWICQTYRAGLKRFREGCGNGMAALEEKKLILFER